MDCTMMAAACMVMNNNNMMMMNNMNMAAARNNRYHGPVRSQNVSNTHDDIVLGLILVACFSGFMIGFDGFSIWIFQLYIKWYFIIFYCVDALMLLMLFIYVCSTCCIRPKLGILKVGFILTGIFFILQLASITTVGIMCSKLDDDGCYGASIFPGFNVVLMLFIAIALYVIISKYQVSKKATNTGENNNNAPTENNDNQTV